MRVKPLRSWKITTAEPFYPINLQCIEHNEDVAITTYAPHVFNTFIVRNFREAIELDKPVHKSYLHDSLYPERILDVANNIAENVILLENGRIKYFKSARHLDTVAYLQNVKTICRHRKGFALIRMSDDSSEFFFELHPDEFHAEEIENRQIFNITFDKIPELQSTWNQTLFKIKELHMNANGREFLKMIFPEGIITTDDSSTEPFLFLSMDSSFCSIHVLNDEPIVNPIVQCTSKIVDFWAGANGAHILLLLENGAMEILYIAERSTEITRQHIYFGSEMLAFRYINGVFYYSNGFVIQHGSIEYNDEYKKFIFTRKSVDLPGIVGIDVLPQFNVILCISENCQFYALQMQIQTETESEWLEVDECVQRQLTNVKCQVLELTDTYDELLEQHSRQQHTIDVINLKRADLNAIKSGSDDSSKYRFVATCIVTRSPDYNHPTLDSSSTVHTINIPNHTAYDRNKSFFVHIMLSTVTYANEFDANIWHLKCGWTNDRHENEYANCCLLSRCLLAPIRLIIHLQQQHLPVFQLTVATMVSSALGSSIEIGFPVRVDQPDYSELIQITRELTVSASDDGHLNEISSMVFVPKIIAVDDLFGDKLKIVSNEKTATNNTTYLIGLLDKKMFAVHYPDKEVLQVRTSDPDLMYTFKMFIYRCIKMKLKAVKRECNVHIVSDALKEYLVRLETCFFLSLIQCHCHLSRSLILNEPVLL